MQYFVNKQLKVLGLCLIVVFQFQARNLKIENKLSDFVFSTYEPVNNNDLFLPPYVAYFDASTGKDTEFIRIKDKFVTLVGWSPSGKYLAVAIGTRNLDPLKSNAQLCIYERTGQAVNCLEAQFSDYLLDNFNFGGGFPHHWSVDETHISFIVNQPIIQLIDADVKTGKTIRVLAEFDPNSSGPVDPIDPVLDWTSDLSSVLLRGQPREFGLQTVYLSPLPLISENKLDLNSKSNLVTDLGSLSTSPDDSIYSGQPIIARLYPCSFSPDNRNIVFVSVTNAVETEYPDSRLSVFSRLTIKDLSGKNVADWVTSPAPNNCLSFRWAKQENAIFFLHDEYLGKGQYSPTEVLKFDVTRQNVEKFIRPDRPIRISSPFEFSADDQYIVFITQDNPQFAERYPNHPSQGRIGIVTSTGNVQFFGGQFQNAFQVLWVPPLKN